MTSTVGSASPAERPVKLGPVTLADGVRSHHALAYLFAAFFTIGLLVFEGVGTPYLLSEHLGVPVDQQGSVTGTLAFWTEIILIAIFTPVGVLADRWGRRPVYALGFVLMALGYAAMPFATTVNELLLARIFYAIGIGMTSGMLATVLCDYPREETRGRLVGIVGVLNGIGVVFCTLVLGRLPLRFTEGGANAVDAGIYTFLVVAAICMFCAAVLAFGLKPGRPQEHEPPLPIAKLFRYGLQAGRRPRIALSYLSAFVARGNLVMIGTYLTLWGSTFAQQQGMDTASAVNEARGIFVVSQASALVGAMFAIFLLDRFSRVLGLAVCSLIAAGAFSSMALVTNPLDNAMLPLIALLGVGQIATFLGSTALLSQEAPVNARGPVVGMFNVMGAIGILIFAKIGGDVFDSIGPYAPFLMVGVFNFAVFLGCLFVYKIAPDNAKTRGAAAAPIM